MAEPRQQNLFSLQECHRGRWLSPLSHREEPAQGLVSLLTKSVRLNFIFILPKDKGTSTSRGEEGSSFTQRILKPRPAATRSRLT